MKRESHRGMFDGTDLSTWSSSDRTFKSQEYVMENSTLDQILELLCVKHSLPPGAWKGRLVRTAQKLAGVVSNGVVFSCNTRESSVIFKDLQAGNYGAGIIKGIISHSYLHPATGISETATYLEVHQMNPIPFEHDLYRRLSCGWLCSRQLGHCRLLPLAQVVSHFARTELTIKDMLVTHVLPTPKSYHPHLFDNYASQINNQNQESEEIA
ncbi:hypothetical protein C8R42DRAFT_722038 [Lentinula raphanica]|nr:hypothetical protein C8R42DRAFT_722038 [Lentinula raphanica]